MIIFFLSLDFIDYENLIIFVLGQDMIWACMSGCVYEQFLTEDLKNLFKKI